MSFVAELPLEQYHRDAFANFAPNFSIGTARATAWLSRLAYESDRGKIETVLGFWGLTLRAMLASPAAPSFPLTRTRGLVASRNDLTLLAFSGTDPLIVANWITNFDIHMTPASLHRGFSAGVDAVWPQVVAAVPRDTAPLIIAGHSLGAALAVVAADRAVHEIKAASGVYAFGMPRAGGTAFAARYALHDVTYRLVHGDDIVPSVPPSELGFRHVGRLMRAPRGGVFDGAALSEVGSDDPPFVQSLVAGLRAALPDIGVGWPQPAAREDPLGWAARFLPPRIGDHLPDRYCRAFGRPG